jgi:hypothetical protein
MSKINGEKARAAIATRRRSAQRVKDRAARAAAAAPAPAAKPAAKERKPRSA